MVDALVFFNATLLNTSLGLNIGGPGCLGEAAGGFVGEFNGGGGLLLGSSERVRDVMIYMVAMLTRPSHRRRRWRRWTTS